MSDSLDISRALKAVVVLVMVMVIAIISATTTQNAFCIKYMKYWLFYSHFDLVPVLVFKSGNASTGFADVLCLCVMYCTSSQIHCLCNQFVLISVVTDREQREKQS